MFLTSSGSLPPGTLNNFFEKKIKRNRLNTPKPRGRVFPTTTETQSLEPQQAIYVRTSSIYILYIFVFLRSAPSEKRGRVAEPSNEPISLPEIFELGLEALELATVDRRSPPRTNCNTNKCKE